MLSECRRDGCVNTNTYNTETGVGSYFCSTNCRDIYWGEAPSADPESKEEFDTKTRRQAEFVKVKKLYRIMSRTEKGTDEYVKIKRLWEKAQLNYSRKYWKRSEVLPKPTELSLERIAEEFDGKVPLFK